MLNAERPYERDYSSLLDLLLKGIHSRFSFICCILRCLRTHYFIYLLVGWRIKPRRGSREPSSDCQRCWATTVGYWSLGGTGVTTAGFSLSTAGEDSTYCICLLQYAEFVTKVMPAEDPLLTARTPFKETEDPLREMKNSEMVCNISRLGSHTNSLWLAVFFGGFSIHRS